MLGAAIDPLSFEGSLVLDLASIAAPGVIGRAATLIGGYLTRGKILVLAGSRAGLARNLEYFGFVGEAGQQAHHVVSFGSRQGEAVSARAILAKYNININSPLNGVWLDATVYNGRHLNQYNTLIYEELLAADTQGGAAAVRAKLRS